MNDREERQGQEDLINGLQDRIDELESKLSMSQAKVESLESALQDAQSASTAAPAGDDELCALAATIRSAQRAGHPDAPKHVDNLLRMLGA